MLAVGPSLSIGRPRWERLDEALASANQTPGGLEVAERAWRVTVADPQFATTQPQARFDSLANFIARAVQTTNVVNQTPQTIEDGSGVWATWDRLRSGETRLRLSPLISSRRHNVFRLAHREAPPSLRAARKRGD